MNLLDIFPSSIDPNLVSVYIGRVIKLDEQFSENGLLYVDLEDPESSDLETGALTAVRAKATHALRLCSNNWSDPPEIKFKTRFDGAMNFISSGDFHLKNYCFDLKTQAWFATVSAALNAIGVANTPPVMVSLDVTPFPSKAVNINVSTSATEVVNESIKESIKGIESDDTISTPSIISLEEVKEKLLGSQNRNRGLIDVNEINNNPVLKVISALLSPIDTISDIVLKPIFDFMNCLSDILVIYSELLGAAQNITFPIIQFTNVDSEGNFQIPQELDDLAIKTSLNNKITEFKNAVTTLVPKLTSNIKDTVIEKVYTPIAYIYSEIQSKLYNIVTPIKSKIKEFIATYVKEPLSNLTTLISMAVQPLVSSLPTIVQMVVKVALKKLLSVLLGKPIEYILKAIISPIETIIDNAISYIQDKVGSFISSAINTLICPIIESIQTSLISLMPTFDMSALQDLITDIKSGIREFPKIYIGKDAINPFITFDELNWSDSSEVESMIMSLIKEIATKTSTGLVTISSYSDTIFTYLFHAFDSNDNEVIVNLPQGAFLNYKGGRLSDGTFLAIFNQNDSSQEYIDIDTDTTLIEGPAYKHISSPDESYNYLYDLSYKKFNSKDEFLPYFTQLHTPVMELAEIGKMNTIFEKITTSTWISNGVPYIDIELNGEIQTFICGSEVINGTYGEPVRVCIAPDTYIELIPNRVYYATKIPHIPTNENDLPVGEDLIPVVDNSYVPNMLYIQKINDDGELLYNHLFIVQDNIDNEVTNRVVIEEDTFTNIANKYYIPSSNQSVSTPYMITDLIDKLKLNETSFTEHIPDDNIWRTPSELDALIGNASATQFTKSLLMYLCLSAWQLPPTYNQPEYTYYVMRDNESFSVKTRIDTDSFKYQRNGASLNVMVVSNEAIPSQVYPEPSLYPILGSTQTEIKIVIFLDIEQGDYALRSFRIQSQHQLDPSESQSGFQTVWDNVPTEVFYVGMFKDLSSSTFYAWMSSYLSSKEVSISNYIDSDNIPIEDRPSNQFLASLMPFVVSAIGQEGGFDATVLANTFSKKLLPMFDSITDVMSGLDNVIQSSLETVEELKELSGSDIFDSLGELSNKINSVTETVEPALTSTAKAAIDVGIQSCSMTQSASDKNFSFNSGEDYTLSTISESRAQLPYCKELKREQFLEPNCKVLVLAVGAGKGNLYVIDILT